MSALTVPPDRREYGPILSLAEGPTGNIVMAVCAADTDPRKILRLFLRAKGFSQAARCEDSQVLCVDGQCNSAGRAHAKSCAGVPYQRRDEGLPSCVALDPSERAEGSMNAPRSPRVMRVEAEEAFGEALQALIAKSGLKVTAVAERMGLDRADLYEYFAGRKHFRAAWLALVPEIERLWLAERAADIARRSRSRATAALSWAI